MADAEIVNWIEVWTDPSSGGAFLLVVRELSTGIYELINPHMGNRVLERHRTYSSIRSSIAPEYDLVAGRTEVGEEPVREENGVLPEIQ